MEYVSPNELMFYSVLTVTVLAAGFIKGVELWERHRHGRFQKKSMESPDLSKLWYPRK
jgi:hypothetical protein